MGTGNTAGSGRERRGKAGEDSLRDKVDLNLWEGAPLKSKGPKVPE